jgi:hypothetical protein
MVRPVADPETPRQVFKPRLRRPAGLPGLTAGKEPYRLGDERRLTSARAILGIIARRSRQATDRQWKSKIAAHRRGQCSPPD